MDQNVTLTVKKAAWYESGPWQAEIRQGEDTLWLYWKGQPISPIPEDPKDGLDIDIVRELAGVLHAALQARFNGEDR